MGSPKSTESSSRSARQLPLIHLTTGLEVFPMKMQRRCALSSKMSSRGSTLHCGAQVARPLDRAARDLWVFGSSDCGLGKLTNPIQGERPEDRNYDRRPEPKPEPGAVPLLAIGVA